MSQSQPKPLSTREAARLVGYSPEAVLRRCRIPGVARKVSGGSRAGFVFDIDLEALRAALAGVTKRRRRSRKPPLDRAPAADRQGAGHARP